MTEQVDTAQEQPSSLFKKAGRAALWLGHALAFPISIYREKDEDTDKKSWAFYLSFKKAAVYTLSWWVLQPTATMLFPRAEDVLKENDLDPKIAQELAPDKDVYVRSSSFFGKLHAVTDVQPFVMPVRYHRFVSGHNGVRGFADRHISDLFPNMSAIYVSDEKHFESLIVTRFDANGESVGTDEYKMPLSPELSAKSLLLHELAHINENDPSGYAGEMYAEYEATRILHRSFPDQDIVQKTVDDNALFAPLSHDGSLYITMKFNGEALPSMDELRKVAEETRQTSRKIFVHHAYKAAGICDMNADAMTETDQSNCSFKVDRSSFSELAQRRLKLTEMASRRLFSPDNKIEESEKAAPSQPKSLKPSV